MSAWCWVILLAGLALAGCGTSQVVLLEEGGAGRATLQTARERVVLEQPGDAASVTAGAVQRWQASGAAPGWGAASLPPDPLRFRLYLRDAGALSRESEGTFAEVLGAMRQRAPAMVSVVGHTDSLGEARYNEQVGMQRAQQLARRLQRSGVEVLHWRVASHGEADPLVKTPDETYEPRNRRVEVWVQ